MQKNCLRYPVEFVRDVFGESDTLAETLRKVSGSESPRVLIVADLNVVQRVESLGAQIGRYVQAHDIRLAGSPVVMASGEKIKADNFMSALHVMSAVLDAKLGKNDIVLALGGGTLLDVAGYAAAQVRGGVKLVRMPTTPVAMIGACHADYAAIDSSNVKDALRVPSVPSAVVIDVGFAQSVLDGVWRSGLGEAFRLAVSSDSALMKKIVKLAPAYCGRDPAALTEIAEGVAKMVAKKGVSRFGCWSAARLESMSCYKLPYGYAVSMGTLVDVRYSKEKGVLNDKDFGFLVDFMTKNGLLDGLPHSQHLFAQSDVVLFGLDAWQLATGSPTIELVAGVGKSATEESPDRAVFKKVMKDILSPVSSPAER